MIPRVRLTRMAGMVAAYLKVMLGVVSARRTLHRGGEVYCDGSILGASHNLTLEDARNILPRFDVFSRNVIRTSVLSRILGANLEFNKGTNHTWRRLSASLRLHPFRCRYRYFPIMYFRDIRKTTRGLLRYGSTSWIGRVLAWCNW